MSNLKTLRSRIKTVKSTQKITKAMQLVSATKLKKIRTSIEHIERYLNKINDIANIIATDEEFLNSLSEKDKKFFVIDEKKKNAGAKSYLLILMTSERGLCGAFNSTIIRKIKSKIVDLLTVGKKIKIVVIGKKGYDALKNDFMEYIDVYFNISNSTTDSETVIYALQRRIIHLIDTDQVESCFVYFSKFKNAMSCKVTELQVLPITPQAKELVDTNIFEYEGSGCVGNIINLYIGAQLSYALTNNIASEEGSRMISMDSATKNADKITNELTLLLNRSRQAIITRELIEIISSAEAL